jgi:hypothetical protein
LVLFIFKQKLILIRKVTHLICLALLFTFQVKAQNFVHAESYTGLDVLEENNGVAVADYDGDLDLDIFVVAKGKENVGVKKSFSKLFRNNNDGSFTDVTIASGLVNLFVLDVDTGFSSDALDGWKYAVSWGDYDNDGFPDIFFTYSDKIQLFHNLGNGTFEDVTTSSGITEKNRCKNTGATWFDYNKDGFLDIFINDWGKCESNTLYKNNGDGTFENVTSVVGIEFGQRRSSYSMVPFDFNNDGWHDIYVTNDFEGENNLFINQNGNSFIDQAITYGLNSDKLANDMGLVMSDFNNDGDFDIFMTGVGENILLENNGSNVFMDATTSNNITATGWAWGSDFSDFDLDGDEDLFIVNGYKLGQVERNVYYKNLYQEGSNRFEDLSIRAGLGDLTMSTEAASFDYDNDGDLDIFVTNTDRPSYFYENKILNANEPNNLNWFKVSLQGTVSNRDAIGTIVSITTNTGIYSRYYSGVGFLSQSLQPIHFGLGSSTQINELKIEWPSGVIETYQNLEANITLKATEGQGFEILNIQPSAKISGCVDPNSCNYNPQATLSDNSCEYINSEEIVGPVKSGFNKVETYTLAVGINATANWIIEGGDIVNGQGTNRITVKWGLAEEGNITATERSSDCLGELRELSVSLDINNTLDNVSVARIWNEALLEAIRKDYARPTVHARNLFHTSIALYDAWAIYDKNARPYLIGNKVHGFESVLNEFFSNEETQLATKRAMSYAVYRLLTYRFKFSPGSMESQERFDLIMDQFGYDKSYRSIDYESGNSAALGNYIAQMIIDYGALDGANEAILYNNTFYTPVNPALKLTSPDDPTGVIDPNRWQPLSFRTFIDQSGNLVAGSTPSFLGPEWGGVKPFSLMEDDRSVMQRDGNDYPVYLDPGTPPQLDVTSQTASSDLYKWNFSLVALWSSQLDPADGVMWDISPKSIGNIDIALVPESFSDYSMFYNEYEGGDISKGHPINPVTGQPYQAQVVPRADYARVLAEFWADGPDSETPPGHWFTILNYVSDHPLCIKKFNGQGEILTPLEWDVKAYFILAGAMHDAAVTAWGIKGWHDYVRPITAIRYMAELGQSTDANLSNYHVGGIPLIEGFIETVEIGDPLSGENNDNLGKIKVKAWRGHDAINDADTDVGGVDWILAKNWWPYQRPSFVTPPFAGYISGHSTFSRAAAEVMTLITGDAFFPGGMGEFVAKKDEFLVFEKGPSVDVVLQWATYRDASDQTSLSRIWGGIHPPADDLPGRLIGEKIGIDTYNYAVPYFSGGAIATDNNDILIYPNPAIDQEIFVKNTLLLDVINVFDVQGRLIQILDKEFDELNGVTHISLPKSIVTGLYVVRVNNQTKMIAIKH